MEDFWKGFLVGLVWPIQLLSLRKMRAGEIYRIGGFKIRVYHDFTRWNSVRFRWRLWFNHIVLHRVKP